MSELKVCRICLKTRCKIYKFDSFELRAYYEEVVAQKVNDKDGLPQYFCYECATMLHKFHKFKEKCFKGQKVFKKISSKGPITYAAVNKINRVLYNLKSSLDILTVTKKVKTYYIYDHMETSDSDNEPLQVEDEKEISLKDIETSKVFLDGGSLSGDHLDSNTGLLDEDTKNIITEEEAVDTKITEYNIKDFGDTLDGFDEPDSPEAVFVDTKNDEIQIKCEPISKRQNNPKGKRHRNSTFATKNSRRLDPDSWKIYTLSEKDAMKEFQAKGNAKAYLDAAYQCKDCFKGFSKEDMLTRHIQLRHSETLGPLECRFCHMLFKWDCQLRKHMRQHYTRYKCLVCDLRCSVEGTALMHQEYHKGITKKCRYCDEEFFHISTYYTHLRTHRSEYLCTLCGESFVSTMGLQMHKKIKHVTNEIESPDDDEEVNTFCEKCDIRFETRKAYEEHMFHSAMHTEGIEDEVNELTNVPPRKVLSKKLQAEIKRSLKRRKTPTDDDAMAPLKAARRKRKIRKTYKKPTTCHQCGEHFETQAACMKHHLQEHPRTSFFSNTERIICEICGASLAPGSVAVHENMHSKKRLFPCETCGRTFYSNVSYKRHILTHTGEKPFACTLCDKRFTQSNSMKLHYNTFHLKMPYPKRNRRKKKGAPPLTYGQFEKSSTDESDTSAAEPANVVNNTNTHEENNMHYLTLN